jgi:hypothetical protein
MWTSVSISRTGQYGIACVYDGYMYSTSDYGNNWKVTSNIKSNWQSVSISGTGQYGIACACVHVSMGDYLSLKDSSNNSIYYIDY